MRGKTMKKLGFLLLVIIAVLGIAPVALAQEAGIETVCLVTDTGRINDGTFNQFAYEGMTRAADEFDLESTYIETIAATDYEANINSCIEEGYEAIVTVGFMLGDATMAAAQANPDVYFIGVDQFVMGGPTNYAGIQFREDQSGFLAGVLAALVAEQQGADTIAGIYGMEIPPVIKFRNGYEQGAHYINPDLNILGVYIASFTDAAAGASAAAQFIGEGAAVIFGAGGQTGSGGILAAAQSGVYVIGVDQDEYITTFGNGETPGAEFLIGSAMKRVDQGVYTALSYLAQADLTGFAGGGSIVMDAAMNGVAMAPKHDSSIPDEIYAQVDEIAAMLASGELETGVDPNSGALLETWVGTADFGEFLLVVSTDGKQLLSVTYNFNNWTCGESTLASSESFTDGWTIRRNRIDIVNYLTDPADGRMTLVGVFDSETHAAGNWAANWAEGCLGTWEAVPQQ
jgi:basic membrane lipoprotein Med (substrate-binding protein (PBP1-ABC) superfamily)